MTGWRAVHAVMHAARLDGPHASPKASATASASPPSPPASHSTSSHRWLGHAQLTATAIYANAVGAEEQEIAKRMWGWRQPPLLTALEPGGPCSCYIGGGDVWMSTTTTTNLAEHVIATLRAHEAELRKTGIRHLSLFGSVARGDAAADSDLDLAAEFDPAAEMDLIRLIALERRLGETLGRPVEILPEPVENPRLRANVERDRVIAF